MAKIPFDIQYRPQIESGEYKVETRDGLAVTDIHLTKYRDENVVVYYVGRDMWICGEEGNVNIDKTECKYDLFIVTPEEELTEFEKAVYDCAWRKVTCKTEGESKEEYAKRHAAELLTLAREQFIKDGYIIEKKAFHDAVEKVSPEVMKEVSENIGQLDALEQYRKGRENALKDLPRWSKNALTRGCAAIDISGLTGADYIRREGKLLSISDLEKLPGFKED